MPVTIFLALTMTAAEPPRLSFGVGQEVGFRVQSEWVRGKDAEFTFRLANGDRTAVIYPRVPAALRSRGARLESQPEGEPAQ